MRHIAPPQIPDDPPPILTEKQIKALLKACSGTTFEDRRDLEIVTLFLDTGLRLSELCYLAVDDVDVTLRTVTVVGKGTAFARPA